MCGLIGPFVDQREQRLKLLRVGKGEEHPAAFLAALQDARVRKDLQVARDTGLALPENMGELADRKLHDPQERNHAQARRIGKRLESIGKRKNDGHQIRI